MSFEPAGDFLFAAVQKYQLKDQALAALVCEKIRGFFREHYPTRIDTWNPIKFKDGILFIKASNAATSSDLFLHTHALLEEFATLELPTNIREIRIVKN